MMGIYRRWRERRRARIARLLRAREAGRGLGPRPGTGEVERARAAASLADASRRYDEHERTAPDRDLMDYWDAVEEARQSRGWAKAKLADVDAEWTPERWARARREIGLERDGPPT